MRKRIATLGERGSLIRLFLFSTGTGASKVSRYVVQWTNAHKRREQESFPGTKAGRAEAEAFMQSFAAEQGREEAPPLTVRALWTAYLASEAEHLRPNTLRLYRDAWRTWEQFIGENTVCDDITILRLHEYRKELDSRKLATATVQDAIRNVRIVFSWGERMELVKVNRWHLFVYKVAKEKRTKPRAEYRADEFLKIWGALNPELKGQWRAWVAVGLLGIYGNRQNEILNLQWAWIDGDRVSIPSEVVKTGEDATLTLFPLSRRILDVAAAWRARDAYEGSYVLYPADRRSKRPSYSIQSLTDAIHRAERRSGVEVVRWRAGHGFRRGLVGDLAEQTGDVQFALQAIGDKDLRMAQHYRSRRDDRVTAAVQERAERLTESATNLQSETGTPDTHTS